jgi:hypothetical protein
MTNFEYESLPVVGELPSGTNDPHGGKTLLRRMSGARIVRIGGTNADIEGGGFIIDYICGGENQVRRVVFAFTELGMWVEYEGHAPSSRAAILDGIPG